MKLLLILLFLGLNLLGLGQTRGCQSLHEGKFKITTKETGTTIFTRTKNLQIEENSDFGFKMIFNVTWIDDCTYVLRPKKVTKGDPSLMGKKGNFLTIRIKDVKENSYVGVTTSNFFDTTQEFKIEVLK